MTGKSNNAGTKEKAVKNPFEWLLRACLLLLACAIVLNLTINLLACTWPWLIGIAAVSATIWITIRIASDRRRKW